ncbi:MAG: hypothetical protein R3C14_27700 [Caldilineaceae bacterium]
MPLHTRTGAMSRGADNHEDGWWLLAGSCWPASSHQPAATGYQPAAIFRIDQDVQVRLCATRFWAVVTLIGLSILFSACRTSYAATLRQIGNEQPQTSLRALTLHAPTEVQADAPVTITVSAIGANPQQPLYLTIVGTYGTTLLTGELANGIATFALPTSLTEQAGRFRLTAQSGTVRATSELVIQAGAPVEPLLALVGPRSITADTDHWAMLVAIPQDRYGNPVADDTAVTVRALHPAPTTSTIVDNDLETLRVQTQYLLAAARIYGRTTAGAMLIAANSGNAHSAERMVRAVPGLPLPFTLRADAAHLIADGRQLVTIRTSALVDPFENLLLDGTIVTFWVQDENSTARSLPTQLVNGQAEIRLQAPSDPGTLTIQAQVLDSRSSPLTLHFTAGLAVAPIITQVISATEEIQLRAGPLLGLLSQYVPDGSIVTFELVHSSGAMYRVDALADGGFATGRLRRAALLPGAYQVTVQAGANRGQTAFMLVQFGVNTTPEIQRLDHWWQPSENFWRNLLARYTPSNAD